MLVNPHRFDQITEAALRSRGGAKWDEASAGEIPAWVAEMDFGTAPAVTAALHDWVDNASFGYVSDALLEPVRRAVSAWYASRHGVIVDRADVHPVGDVLEALEIAIETYSRPGSAVVVTTPGYPPFLELPGMLGRELIEVPHLGIEGRPAFDLDRIEDAFRSGAGLLVVCNPYNPMGVVWTPDELAPLADLAVRYGVRVFSDEIHAPLVYAPNATPGVTMTPSRRMRFTASSTPVSTHSRYVASGTRWGLPVIAVNAPAARSRLPRR
jgi:cystathionine beta-lyase